MEQAINFVRTYLGSGGPTVADTTSNTHKVAKTSVKPVSSIPFERGPVVATLVTLATILFVANLLVLSADHLTGYDVKWIQRLSKIFSVDRELNAPAFFSTLILLFSSGLLAVISYIKRIGREPYFWYWAILALGFLFMAFDETTSAHERLIEPMRTVLGETNLGIFYFAWVVPAIALVLVLGLFFLRFWWSLPLRTRTLVFLAGVLYLGGAIGVELINGNYAELHGKENLTYMVLSTMEECLEVTGTIVFIYALLGYISEHTRMLVFRLGQVNEPNSR